MKRYVAFRTGQAIFAFWLVTIVLFSVSEISVYPVRAFFAGSAGPPGETDLVMGYAVFIKEMVSGFDLPGDSPSVTSPVLMVLQGVPKTVYLLALSLVWALVLSVPSGLLSAAKRGTWIDTAVTALLLLAFSLPTLWGGLWIVLLVLNLGWTWESPGIIRLLMAAFTFGFLLSSVLIWAIRDVVVECGEPAKLSTLGEPNRWRLVARSTFRSAIGSQPPFFLLTTAVLITGLASVEAVFGWNGAARWMLNPGGFYALVFVFGFLAIAALLVRDLYLAVRQGSGTPVAGPTSEAKAGSSSALERRRHSPLGRATAIILLVVLVLPAIFGPTLAPPHDPVKGGLPARLLPPAFAGGSGDHVLGTDRLGRDILSRVLHGYRIAFTVAFFSVLVAVAVGAILAIAVTNCPGTVRSAIGNLVSGYAAIPALGLGLALLISFVPNSAVFFLVGSVMWPIYFYRINGDVRSSRGRLGLSASSVRPVMALAALHFGFVVLLSTTIMGSGVGVYGVGPARPSPEMGKHDS